MTHPGGRPLKFDSVEDLNKSIQEYFTYCLPHPEQKKFYIYHQKDETYEVKGEKKTRKVDDLSRPPYEETKWIITEPKTPTVTGLALHLNTSRQTLINYEDKDKFFDTIKEAKDIIENHWEEMLRGSNVTGVIFNLKNNYGWKDKTESEISNPDGSLSPYRELTKEELRKLAEK